VVGRSKFRTTTNDFNNEASTMQAITRLVGDDRDLIPAGTFH